MSVTLEFARPSTPETSVAAELADAVCAADPLDFDPTAATVPLMNATGDVNGLVGLLRARLATGLPKPGESLVDDLASMRDLGIVLGSLKRHDVEPLELVPELTPSLLDLGRATAMVPRDTILHYTLWNPVGERERTYTADGEERALIESVRMVFPQLPRAIDRLADLHGLSPVEPDFASGLVAVATDLDALIASMRLVRSQVSPIFFTLSLRPYLEAILVDGTSYFGPAAAQLPIWLIDQALFPRQEVVADAAALPDPADYAEFWRALVPYSVPRWRGLLADWESSDSLGDRVVRALRQPAGSPAERAHVESAGWALAQPLRTLVSFRGAHLGIAQRSYDVEDAGFDVGSGGGSIALLREILTLTKSAVRQPRPTG